MYHLIEIIPMQTSRDKGFSSVQTEAPLELHQMEASLCAASISFLPVQPGETEAVHVDGMTGVGDSEISHTWLKP